jgi:hypothetical protein
LERKPFADRFAETPRLECRADRVKDEVGTGSGSDRASSLSSQMPV